MKKLFLAAALTSVFIGSTMTTALALPNLPVIPLPTYMEFDLDNWTRLFRDGQPIEIFTDPVMPGDFSRAFITLNDIAPTAGAGGPDGPATWVGGVTDGTYLHGWEDNVVVQSGTFIDPNDGVTLINQGVIPQADGSANLYFTHRPGGGPGSGLWEFEVYQTEVTWADFVPGGSSDYLQAGPTMFDTIKANLVAPPGGETSEPFVRGMFSDSLYVDPFLADPAGDGSIPAIDIGFGPGVILASAAINATGLDILGGEWVNQVNLPYLLGVNAFVDVDPTWGYGDRFNANFYGSTVASFPPLLCPTLIGGFQPCFANSDPYDVAIQNVRLNSELTPLMDDQEGWIVSDDGIRGASGHIPEPATMLLLGMGLVGIAGISRRKNQA